MKETIYTIPINEAFDHAEGCPVCSLYTQLEHDSLEYVLGAAMMEPAVRVEMNAKGFCCLHFTKMLKLQKRLSLALILESHLEALAENPRKVANHCYICDRVDVFLQAYYRNILYLWTNANEFREKFNTHDDICLAHMASLLVAGQKQLRNKHFQFFSKVQTARIAAQALDIRESVSGFCKSFDYLHQGNSQYDKNAVENAVFFLTGGAAGKI